LTFERNGLDVTLSWPENWHADGYKLSYAPYPFTGMDSVSVLDFGRLTTLDFTLWDGGAFIVAVQAYNYAGDSEYSNIEYVIIDP